MVPQKLSLELHNLSCKLCIVLLQGCVCVPLSCHHCHSLDRECVQFLILITSIFLRSELVTISPCSTSICNSSLFHTNIEWLIIEVRPSMQNISNIELLYKVQCYLVVVGKAALLVDEPKQNVFSNPLCYRLEKLTGVDSFALLETWKVCPS